METELKLAEPARNQIYRSILDSSNLDLEYVAMLAFAGLIALFGLLQNSVAVIIGAMLISPLMNPVLAGALALVLGDWSLGRRSATVLAWSIGGVIALTWLVTWLTPLKQVTPEILARTNPNLLDMLIAVLAGLAGTLALRGGPVSMTIIPGVAIAVAVVPPLSVVGFSLSLHRGSMAWGGFLLFITNLVSIMISAAAVFRLMGFSPHEDTDAGKAKLRKRMAVSALVLIILAVPLIQTLRRAVKQLGLRSEINQVIERAFKTDHSAIADTSYSKEGRDLRVNVTLRTTQYFDASQIEQTQSALSRRLGADTRLMVEQVLVNQGGLSPEQMARIKDFISGGAIHTESKKEPFDLKASNEKITDYLQKQVDEALAGSPIRRTEPVLTQLGAGDLVVMTLHLASGEPVQEQTVKLLESQLSSKVSVPIEIHGVVELGGPDYAMTLEFPDDRLGVGRQDRAKVAEMIARSLTRNDLQVRTSLIANAPDIETLKISELWRDMHGVFSRGRLKDSRWTMVAAPIPAPPAVRFGSVADVATAPKEQRSADLRSRRPVRCSLNVLQVF